jgi:predicted metallo-beta-lactamase superfamily hydrolase
MGELNKIRVLPIASESLGVRSMCTYVETPDVGILLDAGVSLGPNRYGFSPHPKEYAALKNRREAILKFAEKADVVTVSHYHFDHHTPSYTDWAFNWCSAEIAEKIYSGKIVLTKNYRAYANFSQRRRGWLFVKTSGNHADRLEVADGRTFAFGETLISFSKPVYHGSEGSDLGWVLMVTIRHGNECFLFAPDVQGPISRETLNIILSEKPQMLIIGGPPTYLADFRMDWKNIELAMDNLMVLAKRVPTIILDHHVLRDEEWESFIKPIANTAMSVDHKVLTAAEFLGNENCLLESMRRSLYVNEPPRPEFARWSKIPAAQRKLTPPPI